MKKGNTKMFKAKIQVKQNGEVKWEYLFSDTTKEGLFKTTANYFHGYISAMADFTKITLQAPSVMSLDGYYAWSNGSGYTIQLLNEEGYIIAKVDDII